MGVARQHRGQDRRPDIHAAPRRHRTRPRRILGPLRRFRALVPYFRTFHTTTAPHLPDRGPGRADHCLGQFFEVDVGIELAQGAGVGGEDGPASLLGAPDDVACGQFAAASSGGEEQPDLVCC
jgi:hypothetical protein